MATSYIKYNGSGFWEDDTPISILAGYMYVEIHCNERETPWLRQYAEELRLNSHGDFVGFTSLLLEDYATSPERTETIIRVLSAVETQVKTRGEILDLAELNDYVDDNGLLIWNDRRIASARISELAARVRQLLEGPVGS